MFLSTLDQVIIAQEPLRITMASACAIGCQIHVVGILLYQ